MASQLVQKFRNDTAPRLLAKFSNGGVAVVVQVVAPNPDPLMPPSVSETTVDVNAYVSGVSAKILAADSNLLATDLQVLVAAVNYDPKPSDIVRINGVDKGVVRVDAIPASGDPAIYRFFLR